MRIAPLASIGIVALASAALAQVAGTPTEQKIPAANGATDDGGMPAGDNMTRSNGASPMVSAAPSPTPTASATPSATPTTESKSRSAVPR